MIATHQTERAATKACGREKGEKRSKYPACRPTPAACKERGKGKTWGKKAAKQKKKNESIDLQQIVKEEQAVLYKPGLLTMFRIVSP